MSFGKEMMAHQSVIIFSAFAVQNNDCIEQTAIVSHILLLSLLIKTALASFVAK
jgi:hypothetical protein